MSLIIEDGTGVAGADSYVTLEEARAYAASRGLTLSSTDATLESYLRRATDYLEAQRDKYKGHKTDATYPLQWPRKCVYIDCTPIDSDVIPAELKQAQIQLAAAINSGIDIMPTATGEAFITLDKVGPIETRYSESIATSGVPIVRTADALLAVLYRDGGGLITTERA